MSDIVKQTKRQLVIQSGVVKRLAKEVDVYLREHAEQLSKVKTLEAKVASFSNTAPAPAPAASEDTVEWDWELKNALKVQDDCVQMIEPARARLEEAKEKLEDLLDATKSDNDINSLPEYSNAKKILEEAVKASAPELVVE